MLYLIQKKLVDVPAFNAHTLFFAFRLTAVFITAFTAFVSVKKFKLEPNHAHFVVVLIK